MLERENASDYGFEVLAKPLHPNDLIRKLRDKMSANPGPPDLLHPPVSPS
jgi:hypothetical protein